MDIDFSDAYAFVDAISEEVVRKESEIGEEAVRYAVENGDYQDRTGTLRRSNKYEAREDGLVLINDAASPEGYEYASSVEAKGYEVLSGAALYAERRLREEFR